MRFTEKSSAARSPFLDVLFLLPVLAGAGWLAACGPSDPIAKVEDARSHYTATLASFSVAQTPTAALPDAMGGEESMAPGEEGAMAPAEGDDATAADASMEEGDAMAEPAEVRSDVILDILMSYDGFDELPGVTVDVTQADADEHEKAVYRIYLDTTDVHRGPPSQMTHRLEDVPFEEGDQFSAEVRSPIPAGERGEYREFSETGEGS